MDKFVGQRTAILKGLDKNSTFVPVDHQQWGQPNKLSIQDLNDLMVFGKVQLESYVDNNTLKIDPKTLKIIVNSKLFEQNVSNVEFNEFDVLTGSKTEKLEKLTMSCDENYLYVWIEKLSKWKRISLLDF